ncbi:MAG: metallophosphoesterase [Saprospiraceae bacterium]|nr:metallophosphoesterase [Saprospiraceae bacterium]
MTTRFLILILLLIGIDLYSFQWLRHLTQHLSASWKWGAYAFFWAGSLITLVLLLFTFIGQTDKIPPNLLLYLRAFAFISYFSKLASLPVLLIDDLRRGAGQLLNMFRPSYAFSPSRSKFLSAFSALLAGIPFVTLLHGMARNAYRYKIHKVKIPVRNLPPALEGLHIVQISDIHSGSFTSKEPIMKSVELVSGLKPDLIFFTGDLVNSRATEIEPYLDIFSNMKGKHGSYSVLGNHDYGDYVQWEDDSSKQANLEKLKSHHAAMGWKLLLNQHDEIQVNGHTISIIGVENFSASKRFSKYGNLSKAYEGISKDSLKLLLSHDPSHWEYEVTTQYPDISLTCSGHTHGFQFGIEIPGYFRWSPSQYVYKQWAGLYQQGLQYLYVNRGFGFLAYPGRVGILPEITSFELTAAV